MGSGAGIGLIGYEDSSAVNCPAGVHGVVGPFTTLSDLSGFGEAFLSSMNE